MKQSKLPMFRLQRSSSIFVAVCYVAILPFYQPVKVEMVMSFCHGTKYLFEAAKPCEGRSHDIVFMSGRSALNFDALYSSVHLASLWLCKCRSSVILLISCQMCLSFPGRGSGVCATLRLLRWHMLSYAKIIFLHCSRFKWPNVVISHDRTSSKTWAGPSDLHRH